jgi:hypothetical protein
LNQLAAFVDFDLSSVEEYDPNLGIPTSCCRYPAFLAVFIFSGIDFRVSSQPVWHRRSFGAPLVSDVLGPGDFSFSFREGSGVDPNVPPACRLDCRLLSHAPVYPLGLGTENFFHFASPLFFLLKSNQQPTTTNFCWRALPVSLLPLSHPSICPGCIFFFCSISIVNRHCSRFFPFCS